MPRRPTPIPLRNISDGNWDAAIAALTIEVEQLKTAVTDANTTAVGERWSKVVGVGPLFKGRSQLER